MEIFEDLGYKLLDVEDRYIFHKLFSKYPPTISEFTFTNLFMWRRVYKFNWKEKNDCILLFSMKNKNEIEIFPPIGNHEEYFKLLLELLQSFDFKSKISRVPKGQLEFFETNAKKHNLNIEVLEDRANWDYVYNRNDLVELSGGNFSNIRRKVNKFKRNPNWSLELLTKEKIKKCLELQEFWCNLKDCEDDESLENEDKAIRCLFKKWDILQFDGIILNIHGHIVAYALGEKLNSNMYVCHVEKANPEIAGSYQVINQMFAENLGEGFKYINREQDLGEEGLRISKTRYQPDHFIEKYIIDIKN